MPRLVDVVIVGGGPAGLASAINLAKAGIGVILFEKRRLPRHRPCGEGLMPTGVAHLEQLQVEPSISHPFLGIRYIAPDGSVASANFREGPGLGIRRDRLSTALAKRAREFPTIELRQGAVVKPVLRRPDGVEVQAGDERLRCRIVVGADGRTSGVRRWANLDDGRRRHWRWGARRHFDCQPWSDHVEVYWSRQGIEAYVTPTGPDEVNVALLWTRDRWPTFRRQCFKQSGSGSGRFSFKQSVLDSGRRAGLKGGDALYDSLLNHFPRLRARLGSASTLDPVATTGPLQQRVCAPIADGLILIGDAAGYTDAITGEGLSLAFAQAASLPTIVRAALAASSGLVPRRALAACEQQWKMLARPTSQLTEMALLLSRFPRLCNWCTRALAREPALFRHLLSANMGLAPLWRPALAARAIWALTRSALLARSTTP